MKEERYCEICEAFVGIMSDEAWLELDRLCENCLECPEDISEEHQVIEN